MQSKLKINLNKLEIPTIFKLKQQNSALNSGKCLLNKNN